jgi:hypothetical protein
MHFVEIPRDAPRRAQIDDKLATEPWELSARSRLIARKTQTFG